MYLPQPPEPVRDPGQQARVPLLQCNLSPSLSLYIYIYILCVHIISYVYNNVMLSLCEYIYIGITMI